MRSLLFAFAFVASMPLTACAGQALPAPLPAHTAPSGLKTVNGTEGGRLLFGTLSQQPSTDTAFRAGLATIRRGYFDAAPVLVGVMRNKDQSVTIAPFTAALGKAPVNGILYTIFDVGGSARVGVLFDYPQHFGKSFQPLMAQFAELNPPPAIPAPLTQVVAEDRTEAVTIPDNWQVQVLKGGFLVVDGPDQARVIIRYLSYFTDPRFPQGPGAPSMPFTADPTAAFSAVSRTLAASNHLPLPEIHVERTVPEPKPEGTVTSAWLYGTATVGGTTRRFETLVQVAPLNTQGRWIVQINQRSAPANVFQRDLPLLTSIYKSYLYDPRKMAEVILGDAKKYADRNNAVVQESMRRAAAIQGDIDRSTAAFLDHISDHAIVTDGSSQGRFTANTANAIVAADPQRFHILSLNEYR